MLFVLTGPESTAKSILTRQLAEHFSAPWIDEVAREYLNTTNYLPSDLLSIAKLQQVAEQTLTGSLGFADTDLQVLYLWWQEKFGPAPTAIATAYASQSVRHYLLCAPDIAWTEDVLRENPLDRDRLFALYKQDLEARDLAFSVIGGADAARFDAALQAVNAVLTN